jgi:hypothetical protein
MPGRKWDCAFGKDLPTATSQRMESILTTDKADDLSNSLSKIKPECASEDSFLGDALSERDRDRIRTEAGSLGIEENPLWPFSQKHGLLISSVILIY